MHKKTAEINLSDRALRQFVVSKPRQRRFIVSRKDKPASGFSEKSDFGYWHSSRFKPYAMRYVTPLCPNMQQCVRKSEKDQNGLFHSLQIEHVAIGLSTRIYQPVRVKKWKSPKWRFSLITGRVNWYRGKTTSLCGKVKYTGSHCF